MPLYAKGPDSAYDISSPQVAARVNRMYGPAKPARFGEKMTLQEATLPYWSAFANYDWAPQAGRDAAVRGAAPAPTPIQYPPMSSAPGVADVGVSGRRPVFTSAQRREMSARDRINAVLFRTGASGSRNRIPVNDVMDAANADRGYYLTVGSGGAAYYRNTPTDQVIPRDAAPGAYVPSAGPPEQYGQGPGMQRMALPRGQEYRSPQINQDFVDRARQRVLAAGANTFQSKASKAEAMRVGGIQSATMDARASGMNKTGQAKYLAERKRMQDFESQAPERAAKRQADIEMERAKAPQAKTQSGPTSPGEMIKNTLARLNNIQMGGNPQAAAAYNSAIVGLSEEDGALLAELLSIDPATAPPDQVEIRKRALANYKLMREKMGQRYDPILDSLVI